MQKKASKSGLSVAYSVYIPRTDNAVSDNENSYDSISAVGEQPTAFLK